MPKTSINFVLQAIALAIILTASGCGLCASEIFQEVNSPDGRYKVVVFQRDCGATTGFRTHISLMNRESSLGDQTGNIFQADGHPDWFAIKVEWVDNQHIRIEHNGKPIPDVANSQIGGISVQFDENTTGILPARPFKPSELLLPVHFFPEGWTSEELRPFGHEEIKGSHENSPYMLYTPPGSEMYFKAGYYVFRHDTIEIAEEDFQQQQKLLNKNYSAVCEPPDGSLPGENHFQSAYTSNIAVGFTEHQYGSSGDPRCKMIAQYDEFFIQFEATVSENGLTFEQFNHLLKIIDQILVAHIQNG